MAFMAERETHEASNGAEGWTWLRVRDDSRGLVDSRIAPETLQSPAADVQLGLYTHPCRPRPPFRIAL